MMKKRHNNHDTTTTKQKTTTTTHVMISWHLMLFKRISISSTWTMMAWESKFNSQRSPPVQPAATVVGHESLIRQISHHLVRVLRAKWCKNHGWHFARAGALWDERVSSFLRKKTRSQKIMSTSGYRCFFAEVLEKPL